MVQNPTESAQELLVAQEVGQRLSTVSKEIDAVADDEDKLSPFDWSPRKKWTVTLVASVVCFLVGINSTSITAAAEDINLAFGESDDNPGMLPVSYWPVTAWNAGAAIFPMFMLPIMEDFGIYKTYVAIYLLFVLFIIPQAVSQNFATLIVTRVIAGSFGGVLQNVLDGIIADMFDREQARSLPVTLYIFCLVGGVSFGPVFGGAVVSYLNWRWIFYIQLIIYAAIIPLVIFGLHETRIDIINSKHGSSSQLQKTSSRTSRAEGKQSVATLLTASIGRPLQLLLTEPTVASMTLLSAFAFGLVFLATQSAGAVIFPEVFQFSAANASLVQVSLVIGEVIGLAVCLLQNQVYNRSGKYNREEPNVLIPEWRLFAALVGSFFGIAGGLFVYGATSVQDLPWIAPAIGLAIVGFGVMCTVQAVSMYITDAYAEQASSAIAGVALGENVCAAFLPLATDKMYAQLGAVWASLLLGFLALVLSVAPIILIWKGKAIRRRSKYTSS